MKFQAATSQIRKKVAKTKSAKAAVKKLSDRPNNVEKEIHKAATAKGRVKHSKEKPKMGKSTQTQNAKRPQGTLQNPARSQARHLRNLEIGRTAHR